MPAPLDLFHPSHYSLFGILGTTFEIFFAEWKVFICLGAASWFLTVLSLLGPYVIFGLIYGKELIALLQHITDSQPNQGEGYRLLVAHGMGSGIVSRFLQDFPNFNANSEIVDDMLNLSMTMLLGIIIMAIIQILVMAFISSCFQGAIIAAVSDVYSRRESSYHNSFSIGWKEKTKVFCYELMFGTGYLLCLVLYYLLCMKSIIFIIAFPLILLIPAASFAAAKPSIVLEKESSVRAFIRSWNLCKGSICLISWTLLIFQGLIFFVGVIISLFRVPVHLFLNVITLPLNTILYTVIYMSRRIKVEGMTEADMPAATPIATVVEFSDMDVSTTGPLKEKGQFKQVNSEDFA